MSKVWIVGDAGHDYSEAQKFGDLEFIFKQRAYPFGRVDVLEKEFNLRDIRENDYLLLSGPLINNAVAAALWLKQHGYVNLLLFNAKREVYVEKVWTT